MPGWFTVFKVIPWMDVIAGTPSVVRGAKRLWTDIREKRREGGSDVAVSMSARVEALEAQAAELRNELNASSEVIKAMAEQNARLVEAVGILRVRTHVLLVACLILVVLSVALGYSVWVKP
jgi:hypothetical protein